MSLRLDDRSQAERAGTTRAIRRWVGAGLITEEQGDAILRAEEERTAGVAPRSSRVPLVAEVLAYTGAALALAACGALLRQHWHELAPAERLALAGGAAALLLVGGWLIRNARDPALQRLGGVLWLLSAGMFGGFVAIVAVEGWHPSAAATALTASAAATAYAAALWAWRSRVLQLLALAGAAIATVGSVLAFTRASPAAVVLTVWMFGLAWFAAAELRFLRPRTAAYVLGALTLLIAPWVSDLNWPSFLGLATATALMAVGVHMRQTPLLFLGAIGLFGFLTRVIVTYFAATIGVPIAMLCAGVLLIGVALVTARLYRSAPRSGTSGKR